MRQRHSLRFRVAAAFAGLGAFLSLLFAVGIWLAAHDVSNRLMDQTLTAELDDYMARRARNPHSLPPQTATLHGYVAEPADAGDDIPPQVRTLLPGRYELSIDGTLYRILVADGNAGERYYILFNEERQRARERGFIAYLIAGALAMTVLAAGGGLWLAGRVIAPVTDLARAVAHAPTDNPPRLTSDNKPQDEIGELTRSFDRYFARLSAFIERERAFAADASHELRTPLTVIRGAAEVLAEDEGLTAAQAERIGRIERAAAEMSALTSALLLLAREDSRPPEEPCGAVQLVHESVEHYLKLAAQRHNSLDVVVESPPCLFVEPALFSIVVDNLVRNALAHTEGGRVTVRLCADRLVVADTGIGIDEEDLNRVFQRYYRGAASDGAGIGLSLVKRICDRQAWRIELESRPGGGTRATLFFSGGLSSA